jgi:predicted nucleic acid-binding protein
MQDKIILDSSIIAAIFFREKASSKAVQAIQDQDLITVDLAMAEVANVAWKRVAIFHENEEIIREALKRSTEFIRTVCEVISTEELIERSFQIALEEKISLYDSLFLAASEKEETSLLTLDKRFKNTSYTVELL